MLARPGRLLWAEARETYIGGCKADLSNDTIVSSPGQSYSLATPPRCRGHFRGIGTPAILCMP